MNLIVRRRVLQWLPWAVGLLVALLSPGSRAQQPGSVATLGKLPFKITADTYEFDAKTGRGYAKGNILLGYKDITVTADEAEVDLTGGDMSASGNVVLKRGLFSWHGSKVQGNFKTREFTIGEYAASTGVVYISGVSGQYRSNGSVELSRARLSTCEYLETTGKPHYSLDVGDVVYQRNGDFVARNVVYRVFGIPIFWLPIIWGNTNQEGNGVEIRPGYSGDWGPYLLLAKGWHLNKYIDTKLRLDLRGKHGIAVGNETTVTTPTSRTAALIYAMDDSSPPNSRASADAGKDAKVDSGRYRLKLSHYQTIRPDLTLRMNIDKLSDIDMLQNWYRKEYRINPQPPSFGDLTWERDRFALSLTVRPQVNDFYSAVEELPTLKFQMPRQPLWGSGFFYQGESSAAELKMKWSDLNDPRLPDPADPFTPLEYPADYQATRFDSLHMLYYPLKLFGDVEIVPRAGVRLTYYSKTSDQPITTANLQSMAAVADPNISSFYEPVISYDANGGSRLRLAGETGFEISTKFYRTWAENEVQSEAWNIHGLRHIVQPYLNYTLAPRPSIDRDNIYAFDAIDRLIEQNFIRLGVNQRLQTRRSNQIYTLASMETYGDFHFVKEEGFSNLGDFGTRLTINARNNLRFWASLKADMGEMALNRAELGVSLGDPKSLKINLSYFFQNSYDSRTVYSMGSSLVDFAGDSTFARHFGRNQGVRLGLGFPINAKTYARIGYEFDFVEKQFARQTYEIERDLHCWIGALRLEQEANNTSLMLILTLKAYPSFGLQTEL